MPNSTLNEIKVKGLNIVKCLNCESSMRNGSSNSSGDGIIIEFFSCTKCKAKARICYSGGSIMKLVWEK